MKITFTNTFHDTQTTANVQNGVITTRQYNRILDSLCGMPGCRCFGEPHVNHALTHAEPIFTGNKRTGYMLAMEKN